MYINATKSRRQSSISPRRLILLLRQAHLCLLFYSERPKTFVVAWACQERLHPPRPRADGFASPAAAVRLGGSAKSGLSCRRMSFLLRLGEVFGTTEARCANREAGGGYPRPLGGPEFSRLCTLVGRHRGFTPRWEMLVKCDAVSLKEAMDGARLLVPSSKLCSLSRFWRGLSAELWLRECSCDCSKGAAASVLGPAAALVVFEEGQCGLSDIVMSAAYILPRRTDRSKVEGDVTCTKVQRGVSSA
jgi:hypothetical protein